MVRKLKHHEQKLLKRVDFITWKQDHNHRASTVARRYMIANPAEYHHYNRLCHTLRKLAHRLTLLPPDNAVRKKHETALLEKLYDMGVLSMASKLSSVEKISVSAFARRRLPIVMTRLRMAENAAVATKFVEQGHVRIGPEIVTDPAYLVTRHMEDFLTWSVGSKIKQNIMKYREEMDDLDVLQ